QPTVQNRPREALLKWGNGLRDSGYEPQIAEWLNEFTEGKPYRELTVEQLRGVYDTVRSIETTARSLKDIIRKGQRFSLDVAVGELVDKMDQRGARFDKADLVNPPDAKVDGYWAALTHWIGSKLRTTD